MMMMMMMMMMIIIIIIIIIEKLLKNAIHNLGFGFRYVYRNLYKTNQQ
jgi:hypothetical protein